jgi:putative ubiquitin-RnfH superfamily antitoxin RatB of RatAB toxin-antitoxin module
MFMLDIEVAYAEGPGCVVVIPLQVKEGTTIEQAITQSAIVLRCPHIDIQQQKVGIFGEIKALTDTVSAGDRIEIYRPLPQSAIEARKTRAGRRVKKTATAPA